MGRMLEAIMRKGVKVSISCIDTRGLSISELVEGVEPSSMNILVEWVSGSDKVISF